MKSLTSAVSAWFAIFSIICTIVSASRLHGCTTGFMGRELLTRRASKINSPTARISPNVLAPATFLIMPGMNFSCAGRISGFYVGVELRDMSGNEARMNLWRPRQNDPGVYDWIKDGDQKLELEPGEFTPDGLFLYKVGSFEVLPGDVLGVYQSSTSNSPVRLFYTNQLSSPPQTLTIDTSYSDTYHVNPSGLKDFNGTILVRPVSDHEDCMHGFLTISELRHQTLKVNINGVASRLMQQRLFPAIQFICSGFVTKWIVGAHAKSGIINELHKPEIQIWRRVGRNNYTKIGSTVLSTEATQPTANVYEYAVSPLMFQEGDILGVYQPCEEDSQLVIYYQENSGPLNYRQSGNVNPIIYSGAPPAGGYDYPLITVEIDTGLDKCSSKFIDRDLLVRRASKIGLVAPGTSSGNILDRGRYLIIPGMNFSCFGTITGFYVGVELRNFDENEARIDLWRPEFKSGQLTKYKWITNRYIRLKPGHFTPNGLYELNVESMQVQQGDVLGVYQSRDRNSPVRLFYTTELQPPLTLIITTSYRSTIELDATAQYDHFDGTVLVRPISDNEICMHGFLTVNELRKQAQRVNINGVVSRLSQQRLFPDIRFTCSGVLTKWIVGVQNISGEVTAKMPELQIWRRVKNNRYTKVDSTRLTTAEAILSLNVFEYRVAPPLMFQEGDLFGIYQPREEDSQLVVYYQKNSGPVNYGGQIVDAPLNTFTYSGTPASEYDYPLVSVEVNVVSECNFMKNLTLIIIPSQEENASDNQTQSIMSPCGSTTVVNANATVILQIGIMSNSVEITWLFDNEKITDTNSNYNITNILSNGTVQSLLRIAVSETTSGSYSVFVVTKDNDTNSYCIHLVQHISLSVPVQFNVSTSSAEGLQKPTVGITATLDDIVHPPVVSSKPSSHPSVAILDSVSALSSIVFPVTLVPTTVSLLPSQLDVMFVENRGLLIGSLTTIVLLLILISVGIAIIFIYLINKMKRKRTLEVEKNATDAFNPYLRGTNQRFLRKSVVKPDYLPLMSSALITSQQLRLLDVLGQGEFGVVYKSHLLRNSSGSDTLVVAVKTLKSTICDDEVDNLLKESIKMKEMSHPNVMNLLGVCLDAGPGPYLVLPYMENGDLLSYLRKNRNSLLLKDDDNVDEISKVETKLLSMCLQIAKGMKYIAEQKLVHRDLAARNCMIDDLGIIKVADFGLCQGTYQKQYFRQDKDECVKLPIKWMAIESIEDGLYTEKTDVWSFGVTCWEVFSGGKVPYGGLSPVYMPKLLKEGERMGAPINAACSDDLYESIMLRCWHADPDQRPTFSQLQAEISTTLTITAGYMDFSVSKTCTSPETDTYLDMHTCERTQNRY